MVFLSNVFQKYGKSDFETFVICPQELLPRYDYCKNKVGKTESRT